MDFKMESSSFDFTAPMAVNNPFAATYSYDTSFSSSSDTWSTAASIGSNTPASSVDPVDNITRDFTSKFSSLDLTDNTETAIKEGTRKRVRFSTQARTSDAEMKPVKTGIKFRLVVDGPSDNKASKRDDTSREDDINAHGRKRRCRPEQETDRSREMNLKHYAAWKADKLAHPEKYPPHKPRPNKRERCARRQDGRWKRSSFRRADSIAFLERELQSTSFSTAVPAFGGNVFGGASTSGAAGVDFTKMADSQLGQSQISIDSKLKEKAKEDVEMEL